MGAPAGHDRTAPIAGPLSKRSVTIAGHRTSVSLEPEFWAALEVAAARGGSSQARLIGEIDRGRERRRGGRNLSSALRVFLLAEAAKTRES